MELTVFNPGPDPVVYTATGLTLDVGETASVVADERTLRQLDKGALVNQTETRKKRTKSTTNGEDA